MERWAVIGCLCLLCDACGGEAPSSSITSAAPATAPANPAPPAPAPAPPAPAAPAGDSPCAHPALQTLEIETGVLAKTPWELELTYAVDEDAKRGPGFMFLLHSGGRRWETRRDSNNWTKPLMWHGFCWRGGKHPALRAPRVQVQIAPLCKDGKLVETGSCTPAFKQ